MDVTLIFMSRTIREVNESLNITTIFLFLKKGKLRHRWVGKPSYQAIVCIYRETYRYTLIPKRRHLQSQDVHDVSFFFVFSYCDPVHISHLHLHFLTPNSQGKLALTVLLYIFELGLLVINLYLKHFNFHL